MALRDFLADTCKISKRQAKLYLDHRKVWVNRQCVWMAHHRLRQGDVVQLVSQISAAPSRQTQDETLQILSQDSDYLFVFKPAGMLSTGRNSVESLIRRQCGAPSIRAVHRLDRETTGCLLMALTPAAFDAAVPMFKTRKVHKQYQAIVQGRYPRTATTIRTPIEGAFALSHLRCLRATTEASLLIIRIETGRTHQIRRHLALLRHPVLGDRQYGFKRHTNPHDQTIPRIMLHASELKMPHPLLPDRMLRAHAPLPADFRRCLNLFRLRA